MAGPSGEQFVLIRTRIYVGYALGETAGGADSCPNKTVVDEEELIEVLQEYFTNVLKQKKKVIAYVVNEFQRIYKAKDENVEYEKEIKCRTC